MGYDMQHYNYNIVDSWVQKFNPDGGSTHDFHIHSTSHICAFYFIECSTITSYPIFLDPRLGRRTIALKQKDDDIVSNSSEKIHVRVRPGTLILFPGYLDHSFRVQKPTDDPFTFLHTNISFIPKNILNI
jgi:hypothetical protein